MKLSAKILGLGVLTSTLALSGVARAADLSDSEIAGMVQTANDGEIAAAKVAKDKATSKDVKEFASHMMMDHTKNNVEGKALEKMEKIKTTENDAAKSMKKDAMSKIDDLKKLSGNEFDKAYMDLQVSMHKQVLADLDQKLIPAAQDPKLKNFLEDTKTHVQGHLSEAERIQGTLTK